MQRHRALFPIAVVLKDLDGAAEDREELPERLSLPVQHLTFGGPAALAVRGQVLKLFRCQAGERSVPVRCLTDRTIPVLRRAHQTTAS